MAKFIAIFNDTIDEIEINGFIVMTEKELEEYERQLRQKADDIEIYIRVDFNPPLKKVPGGATIPSGFYKTIKSKKLKINECYYFNNTIPNADLKSYRVNCE